MQVALVVNPVSGKWQGERIADDAEQLLRSLGHETSRIQGDDAQHAREQLTKALETSVDTVVVVGGDGAMHDVLPVVVGRDLTLGLLPAGTGNDTARALGIPIKDRSAATNVLLDGHTRAIDLAQTGRDQFVVTVVASGFDSLVNERADAMTWPRGNMRYNISIIAELREFQPLPYTLTLDGETIEREAMLVAVGNAPSYGGGLRMCEGAFVDDGLLDVVVINPLSKPRLMRVFPMLYRGTHATIPEFERHQVREVTLSSPGIVAYGDGERLGPLPMTVTVRPGALRMLVPRP
ncbi:MAG: diacylglycerol kinase [Aeromicrobium sp.]